MSVAKIDIGSVAGIDQALSFLESALDGKAIDQRLDRTISAMIDEAEAVAQSVYPMDVEMEEDYADGKYVLRAKNEGIAFIEFGAGITTDGSGEFAARAPFNVEEGSYSVAQNPIGEFARTGFQYWHYNGNAMNAVVPRPGMELARQFIADNWEARIKEAFGGD